MKKNEMMLAVRVSLFGNIVLFLIKLITLVVVNSLAVATDLGISIISLGVSILLYYAIELSNKPADIFHNYGYGKIENVAEAINGVVLIGLALSMSLNAAMHFLQPPEVTLPAVGLFASALGILINFWGAAFILKLAKKHSSPALRAEGIHYRLEGIISLAITFSFAITIILMHFGLAKAATYIDPAATLIVSALIAVPSARLLREAFMKLLDASLGESSQMEVLKALANHYERYCDFKHIKTRSAGRKRFVDIHLVLPEHISIKNSHKIATALKNDITKSLAESEVAVHVEPCARNCAYARLKHPCPYAPHHEQAGQKNTHNPVQNP